MAAGGVYVTGLKATTKALVAAGVDLEDLKDVMGEVAAEAADTLRPLLPTKSGALHNSVRGNRAKGVALVTIGKARVPYAGPIIYGWPARGIRPSGAIDRTDAVMEHRAPEILERGWARIAEKNGLT